MFLKNSRYYTQKVVDTPKSPNGDQENKLTALTLRRLPPTPGSQVIVKANDRLDIMAQRRYQDPTKFWHIADANSELEANHNLAETGDIIIVPET